VSVSALLGDEAAALGAVHAGLGAAYGYPGTPSTEIMERLLEESARGTAGGGDAAFTAAWCSNEKTAFEAALGASFAGTRALVTMKHVGLNVAADPFLNSALLDIKGGLVAAVADDPGMHSSQNEQDSRFYAAFALVPCLEPGSPHEAYDMTREAFDVSERFGVPVLLRLTTRLSHARAAVKTAPARPQNNWEKAADRTGWLNLPAFSRRRYDALIEKQSGLREWSEAHGANRLEEGDPAFVVITSGLGGGYYEENLADFVAARGGRAPARLHIGAYPLPVESVRRLCAGAREALVIEEGQPFIEERLRGILPSAVTVRGKLSGALPRSGELDPDNVRAALGLPPRESALSRLAQTALDLTRLPPRPPQLCSGCPHGDSYEAINQAVAALDSRPGHPSVAVCADIGCYSLGAAPPWQAIETIVCMGASVGMARGAAAAGVPYAAAVIGDSTFLHSGIPALIDAAAADAPVTVIILDNSTVAMTGCQPTIVPSSRLRPLLLGAGVDPAHLIELEAVKHRAGENAAKLKAELEHRGLSVVIFRRECLEALRKRKKG
jgi:indolepyruvate ferredoxin oxidoreductase alpha subunit